MFTRLFAGFGLLALSSAVFGVVQAANALPAGRPLLESRALLTQTKFCQRHIPKCQSIKLEDASAEAEMQSMYAEFAGGTVDVRYSYRPTEPLYAKYTAPLPLTPQALALAQEFLGEWSALGVSRAALQSCAKLRHYDTKTLAASKKISVSCQHRVSEIEFSASFNVLPWR